MHPTGFDGAYAGLFSSEHSSTGPTDVSGLHLIADPVDNDICTHWKIRFVRAYSDNTIDEWTSDLAVVERDATQLISLVYEVGSSPVITINGVNAALTQTETHVGGTELVDQYPVIGACKRGTTVNNHLKGYLFNLRLRSDTVNEFFRLDENTDPNSIGGYTIYDFPSDWANSSLDTANARVLSTTIETDGTVSLLLETDINSSSGLRDSRYWLGEFNPSGIVLVSKTETFPVGTFNFTWRPLHDRFIAYELDIEKNGIPFYNNVVTTLSDVAALTTGQSNDYTWKVRGKLAEAPDVWGTWTYSWYFRYEDDGAGGGGSSGSLIQDVRWNGNTYQDPYGHDYSKSGTSLGEFTLNEEVKSLFVLWGTDDVYAQPLPVYSTGFPRVYDVQKPLWISATQFYVRALQLDDTYTDWIASDARQEHPGTPAAPSYYTESVTSIKPADSWVNPVGGSDGHWTKDGLLYIVVKIPARAATIHISIDVRTVSGNTTIWTPGASQSISVDYPHNSNNIPDSVTFSFKVPDCSYVKGGEVWHEARTDIWASNIKGSSDRIGAYHYFKKVSGSYETSSTKTDTPPPNASGGAGGSIYPGPFGGEASGGSSYGPTNNWTTPVTPVNNNDDQSENVEPPIENEEGEEGYGEEIISDNWSEAWEVDAPPGASFYLIYTKVAYLVPTYSGYLGSGCGVLTSDDSVQTLLVGVQSGKVNLQLPISNQASAANKSGIGNARTFRLANGVDPSFSYPFSEPGSPWANREGGVSVWYNTEAKAQAYDAEGNKIGTEISITMSERLISSDPDDYYWFNTHTLETNLSNVWPSFPATL